MAEILAVLKTVIEELTSTYEFSYQVPADVVAGSEISTCDLCDRRKGDYGYDGVRFKYAAQGPGTVTFKAVDSNGKSTPSPTKDTGDLLVVLTCLQITAPRLTGSWYSAQQASTPSPSA